MLGYVRQVTRLRREIQLFLLFTLFANIAIGVFALIYNLYLVSLSHREDFIGTYNAVSTITMAAAALVMGPLIGRWGTWACLTYGSVAFVLGSLVLAVVDHRWVILLFGALSGAASAFILVPIVPFIVEWTLPEERSVATAVTFSIQSLSGTLGSLIGGWSPRIAAAALGMPADGVTAYRLTLLAGLGLGAVALAPLLVMQRTPAPLASDAARPVSNQDKPVPRRQVRRRIGVFILAGLFLSLGSGAVVPFYNVYLAGVGASASQIGLIYSLAGIVAAAVGLTAPTIGRRLGPLASDVVLRLLPVPAFALLALAPSLGLAVIAHVLRVMSFSVAWPINSTFISELLPPDTRANAFSLRSGVWNLGYAGASFLAGQIIVAAGYELTFIAFGVAQIASAAVFSGYFWQVRRRATTAEGISPEPEPAPAPAP
ncbi:MAG: MFS transporter [Sphaerobacter sp.]|nr:MFS transporter [Sphaerobacter sp.]